MAKVFISCYRHLARDDTNFVLPAPEAPALQEDAVEITTESIQSKPFPTWTFFIMIKADGPCSLAFGADPEANPKYHFVEGGEVRYYGAQPGHRVAVINSEGVI